MGRAEYWDPVTQSRKPIKSGSIVNNSGLEYTPDDVKAIDNKINNLSTEVDEHLAENVTQAHEPFFEKYREKIATLNGTSPTINLSDGNVFVHTLAGNSTYSIKNAVSGQAHSFTLIINQTATVRTITFPASVKWQGGEIPDLSAVSKTYVLTFVTVDGGTTWLGMFGGEF